MSRDSRPLRTLTTAHAAIGRAKGQRHQGRIMHLWTEAWFGSVRWRVEVVRQSRVASRVTLIRTLSKACLPRVGWVERGHVAWVPTWALIAP